MPSRSGATLMGATDPAKADAGTLRQEFGASIEHNATHGSDAPETAAFELGYFFRGWNCRTRPAATEPRGCNGWAACSSSPGSCWWPPDVLVQLGRAARPAARRHRHPAGQSTFYFPIVTCIVVERGAVGDRWRR